VSFLNGAVVKAIASLHATHGDSELAVGEPPVTRTLFIRKGELVGGYSNDPEERIGTMVARAKGLAPELIEAIAKSAAVKGTMLGDALIAEGLLTPTDLISLLEDQTITRFMRTLTMLGSVRERSLSTMRGVVRRPVGALLISAFRDQIPAPLSSTSTTISSSSRRTRTETMLPASLACSAFTTTFVAACSIWYWSTLARCAPGST
jgi:hypothetical protein